MNKKLKYGILVTLTALLLAACGSFGTTPAPETVIETPTSRPEPILTLEPTEAMPTTVPDAMTPEQYIGLQYPPSPANLSQDFSMIIESSDVYSLSLVNNGMSKMLWLSKITHYDANSGDAYWQVKDVLSLSDLQPGLTLLPDGCRLNDVADSEIFVIGRNEAILKAWRANTSLGKFESIPVDGVKCSSDKAMPL
ncbi:MAG: hypothetical protein QM730_08905 [Anaerolineales bacterium]